MHIQWDKSVIRLAGLLLCAIVNVAGAVELGSAKGTPILGRPLDVQVSLMLDQTGEDTCAEAQAFFGETRARISHSWKTDPGSRTGLLRVMSSQVVDEPVVTLYLAAGCDAKVSRKYVFFTEFDAKASASTTLMTFTQSETKVAVVATVPASVSVLKTSSTESTPKSKSTTPKSGKRKLSRESGGTDADSLGKTTGTETIALKPRKQSKKSSGEKAVARSRLKLQPMDLLVEPTPVLRNTLEIQSQPAADSVVRKAAAALWKAINSTPEEVLRDNARAQTLETQVQQMQSKMAAQQELIQRYQSEADDQRVQKIIALAVLLLVVAAVVGYKLSHRVQAQTPWWQEFNPVRKKSPKQQGEYLDDFDDQSMQDFTRAPPPDSHSVKSSAATPKRSPGHDKTQKLQSPESEYSLSSFHTSSSPVDEMAAAPPNSGKPRRLKRKDAQDSNFGILSPKDVDVQELFDVQEQVDFFVSVGQFDQAIEVLRSHIEGSPDTSAVAYLDLFALYHRLKRKDDYEALIEDFNEDFNAQVPSFEQYGSSMVKHLDDYPAALSRVQVLWPTEKALEVIAESIFRKPDNTDTAFSLEAYRELLLLYAILKDLKETDVQAAPDIDFDFKISSSSELGQTQSAMSGGGFHATEMGSLPTSSTVPMDESEPGIELPLIEMNLSTLPEMDMFRPKASRRLGLDIDLSSATDDLKKK